MLDIEDRPSTVDDYGITSPFVRRECHAPEKQPLPMTRREIWDGYCEELARLQKENQELVEANAKLIAAAPALLAALEKLLSTKELCDSDDEATFNVIQQCRNVIAVAKGNPKPFLEEGESQ